MISRRSAEPVRRLVHVEGRVGRLRGLGTLFFGGWDIHYPLPDGSWGTCRAVSTRPSVLSEGMAVPVLVDLEDPRRAKLDYAPHNRLRNLVVYGFLGLGAVALLSLTVMALVLLAASHL